MTIAPRIANAVQQLNARRRQELESRQRASTILHPGEVASGLSPVRMLQTTLGGVLRPITAKDLAHFRKAVAGLGEQARPGITASEALSLSRLQDIKRATEEIRYSLPSSLVGGRVHFVTSSGPLSKVARHHVNVEFVQYAAALARPGTVAQSALWLAKESAVKVECDCEHFRYFLRFVATAGGWVAGRAEHGFPKVRNPSLDGACCKHLARVLTDLQRSVGLRQRIAQMIEADRARIDKLGARAKPKAIRVSQAEAEAMLPKHARRIASVRPDQRLGVKPEKPATRADVQRAMDALQRRTDISSAAVLAALNSLLNQPRANAPTP